MRKQADCVKLYVRVQKSLNNRSINGAYTAGIKAGSSAASYLDVQQVRQLLGFVVSLAASCIGDEDSGKKEVVVTVQELPESSPSSWDHGGPTHQDAIHIEDDARLTDRYERERQVIHFSSIM